MPVIVGILVAAVAIYLYVLLVAWLFIYCGPPTIVLSALFGLGTFLCVYGWTLFQVFAAERRIKPEDAGGDARVQAKGWRKLFWIPVGVLLALVYVDWAYILLAPMPEALKFQSLYDFSSEALWPLVSLQLKWLPFSPAMAPIRGALDHGIWIAPILLSLALKILLTIPLIFLCRGLANSLKGDRQPAYLQYFYKQAFIDLLHVVEWSFQNLQDLGERVFRVLYVINYGVQALFIWPLTLTTVLALAISAIVGFIALALMLLLHAVLLALIISLFWFLALVLWCMERAVILSRRGYAKCPHAGCHAPVPLPGFRCPSCGDVHDRLIPGRFGVLYRRCHCGGKLLPTLFWLGKGKLGGICPHCGKPMHEGLFAANVHVPIYGGPSSGKTMFMMAATWQLVEGQFKKIRASFIDPLQARDYADRWKPDFEGGRVRGKTVDTLPNAFLLSMRGHFGLPVSLYTYDPAGEALEREEELSGHRFLRYFDGLILLIDPFSLPSFADQCEARTSEWAPTTSRTDPSEMVHRVINALENLAKLSRRRRFRRKVAVVITKADLPTVQDELGITLSGQTPTGDWGNLGKTDSQKIATWLERHEPSLFQLLTTRFSDLRFFATSSLGEPPTRTPKAFRPKNVLQPLCWLLSERNTLTFPAAAKIGGRLAELGAVALVALLFLVAPGFAAYRWGLPQARVALTEAAKQFEASAGVKTPARIEPHAPPAPAPAPTKSAEARPNVVTPEERFSRVYLDDSKRVHAVEDSEKDRVISGEGRCDAPRLAEDGQTVGWLAVTHLAAGDLPRGGEGDRADRLVIYRRNGIVRTIEANAFMIRNWGFWEKGNQVAFCEGGLHFAGDFALYDINTGARLDTSKEPATPDSPAWVRSIESSETPQRKEPIATPPTATPTATPASLQMRTLKGGEFVSIPPGKFEMGDKRSPEQIAAAYGGDSKSYLDAYPRHSVTISKGFWLGRHEVTNGEFQKFVEDTNYKTDAEIKGSGDIWNDKTHRWEKASGATWRKPGWQFDALKPVVLVSWNDAQAYIKWLNKIAQEHYRLPTEAEWEYACRAGTDTEFFWGDKAQDGKGYVNAAGQERGTEGERWGKDDLFFDDGYREVAPIASTRANPWGLYDISGNVWEWCADAYHKSYDHAPADGSAWEDPAASTRVMRGGSWNSRAGFIRCSARDDAPPDERTTRGGIRLAVELTEGKQSEPAPIDNSAQTLASLVGEWEGTIENRGGKKPFHLKITHADATSVTAEGKADTWTVIEHFVGAMYNGDLRLQGNSVEPPLTPGTYFSWDAFSVTLSKDRKTLSGTWKDSDSASCDVTLQRQEGAPQEEKDIAVSRAAAKPRVTIEIAKADDKATVYLNNAEVAKAVYGKGPQGETSIAGAGRTDAIDITDKLSAEKNVFKFVVWNAPGPSRVSGFFTLKANGKTVYQNGIDKQDSTEGVKFEETFVLDAAGNPVAAASAAERAEPEIEKKSTEPPAPEKKTPSGNVSIDSEPEGATVLIDKKEQGKTPLTLELKPGSHGIEVRKDGFKNIWQIIEVAKSDTKSIRFSLTDGKMTTQQDPSGSPLPAPEIPTGKLRNLVAGLNCVTHSEGADAGSGKAGDGTPTLKLTNGTVEGHGQARGEAGSLGWQNNRNSGETTVTVAFELPEAHRIRKIRFNMGDCQRAETWNPDTMTTPLGTVKVRPGSSFKGVWTEQDGDATVRTFEIILKKDKTGWAADWLSIAEIEVLGE